MQTKSAKNIRFSSLECCCLTHQLQMLNKSAASCADCVWVCTRLCERALKALRRREYNITDVLLSCFSAVVPHRQRETRKCHWKSRRESNMWKVNDWLGFKNRKRSSAYSSDRQRLCSCYHAAVPRWKVPMQCRCCSSVCACPHHLQLQGYAAATVSVPQVSVEWQPC